MKSDGDGSGSPALRHKLIRPAGNLTGPSWLAVGASAEAPVLRFDCMMKHIFSYMKVYFKRDTWRFHIEDKHDLYLVLLISCSFSLLLWLLTLGIVLPVE